MTELNHPQPQLVFDIVDTMDVDKLATLFAEGARVVFGNQAPYVGQEAIKRGAKDFFDTIAGLKHTLMRVWEVGDDTIAHVEATYQRKDGTEVSLPVATIYHTNGDGKIDDYRVFFDVTPIYM
ncbi:nuclear transport factor 2 family protein [Mycobacterium stomatepiae]|uniref:SnoaL-like domain-containing protein n=1 Tax=Mycobacterium stomatepiae TaxID=470076 RepID=A0A7I7Q252_9MYCO|nr:nuclear transport factor 2 family protein [Mycobacterium stomatepiae]MCV7166722.1 nuclear transport factor 2 family protein [Mycobacterium stomatepiae]BBY20211.1 hypothetical protein MSTO_04160 [Mycobacterium stomatepiae]